MAGDQEGQHLSPLWAYQLIYCEVFHSCAWFKSTVEHEERSNFNLPLWQVLSATCRAGVMVSLTFTELHQPAKGLRVQHAKVMCLFLPVYMSCPWIMVFPLDPQTALCFLWRNGVIPKHAMPLQDSVKHLYSPPPLPPPINRISFLNNVFSYYESQHFLYDFWYSELSFIQVVSFLFFRACCSLSFPVNYYFLCITLHVVIALLSIKER